MDAQGLVSGSFHLGLDAFESLFCYGVLRIEGKDFFPIGDGFGQLPFDVEVVSQIAVGFDELVFIGAFRFEDFSDFFVVRFCKAQIAVGVFQRIGTRQKYPR